MQAQQQQQYQQNYEFSAQPLPQARYREPEDYQEDSDYQDYQEEEQYYLEELEGQIDNESQLIPDYYIDRPPTPEYKPLEKGKDISTQIEDWELFDFEIEVVPVLQLLVGKTIDQARSELIEDYEAEQLKKHKATFIKKRNAELLVTQRMENVFLRRKEERERRDQQHKLRNDQNKITHQKIVSRKIAKINLSKMRDNVLDQLEDQGFIRESTEQNIKMNFLPWLLEEAQQQYSQQNQQSVQLKQTFEEFNNQAQVSHQQYVQKEQQRRQEVLRQKEERRLLLEERKRKKQEYKRKENLKKQRDEILEKLEKNVILNPVKVENIFEGQIGDIVGEERNNPVAAVFGGLLGQLWISIGTLNQLLEEDQQLNENEILEFIVNLLTQQLKNNIVIHIDESYEQTIQDKIKLMQDDLFDFENQKSQIIEQLIEDSNIYTSFITMNQLKSQGQVKLEELKKIMKSLFQIYFKSLTYNDQSKDSEQIKENTQNEENKDQQKDENNEEDPEKEQDQEKSNQDEIQQNEENGEDKQEKELEKQRQIEEFKNQLENATQLERDMVDAKNKITLKFSSGNQFENVESFLRIRIPFLSEEEIEREIAEQQEEELKKQQQENADNGAEQSENKEQDQNNQQSNSQQQSQQENVIEEKQSEHLNQSQKELTEEQIEAQKYAKYDEFVEIYDGQGYDMQLKENQQKSRRRDIAQENAVLFNVQGQNCAIQDERSALFVRGQILHILKELFPEKFENIVDSVFQQKAMQTDLETQQDFLDQIPNKQDIAIFDQEYQQ